MRLYSFLKPKKDTGEDPFIIQEGKLKGGTLDDFSYRLEWTENSYMASKEGRETVGRSFNFKRAFIASIFLFTFLFLILVKAAWLQIVKGDYYYSMAEGNRIRIARLEAKRGIIYDRKLRPLVRNEANFLLYVIPADLPVEKEKLDLIVEEVSLILGKSADEIRGILATVKKGSFESFRPLFIADNIEYEKAILLNLKSSEFSGVVLSNKSRRQYGEASSLSHLLGYTGKINKDELEKSGEEYLPIDYIGKSGIEYFWEADLKGLNGKKQIEVDALGKEKKIINEIKGEDGHNLVLSLDLDLQKKVEEVTTDVLKKNNLKKASVIVEDPNNGEILAMASFPFYDNNNFARGISQEEYKKLIEDENRPLFDRAVSGEYPSGSTIKPIISVAALEEGVIDENTSFLSVGGLRIGQWFFPDWKAGGHGITNVRKAIAESVNTFFYYIGGGFDNFVGLGVDKIVKYIKLFGLGQELGIDLPGEASGFVPTKEWKEEKKGERWYIGDTFHLAIGQGDLTVTPLQVASFTSVFANKGKLYRPHLVKTILSGDDSHLIQELNDGPVRENFLKKENIEIVRQGMRQTVTAGSARSLSELPVEAAGKTGTAQHSSKKAPHAWFTGFAPYDNPQIVVTVLVEEGKEGSAVAVPIAKEIMKWYFGSK